MQKTFTLIIILWYFNVSAQSITYSNYSQVISSTEHVQLATTSSFNTAWYGITGNGVTWNASSILPNTSIPVINLSYYSPTTTPYASLYPMANYAQYDPALTTVLSYQFYNISADSVVEEGDYAPSTQHEIFQNGDKQLIFPFAYGQSFTDTYEKTNYSNATTVSSYQNGIRTVTFNGFGTLILPQGAFSNVALLSHTRTNNIGPTSYLYIWLDITNGHRLMQYSVNGSSISAAYTIDLPTGINDLKNKIELAIYPNPSNGQFTIKNAGILKGEIEITDVAGCKIFSQPLTESEQKIITNCEAGVYFVKVMKDKKQLSIQKLIVQ